MVSGYKEAMHMRDTALHQANCANSGEQRLRAQVHLIHYSSGFQEVFLSHFIMLFFGISLVTASLRVSVYPKCTRQKCQVQNQNGVHRGCC